MTLHSNSVKGSITNKVCEALANDCSELESIVITGNTAITSQGIQVLLSSEKINLKELIIVGKDQSPIPLDEETIKKLKPNLHLKKFSFAVDPKISSIYLSELFDRLKHLKFLHIDIPEAVESTLKMIGEQCKNLSSLSIASVPLKQKDLYLLSNLKKIKLFQVCIDSWEENIQTVTKLFPNLEELNFYFDKKSSISFPFEMKKVTLDYEKTPTCLLVKDYYKLCSTIKNEISSSQRFSKSLEKISNEIDRFFSEHEYLFLCFKGKKLVDFLQEYLSKNVITQTLAISQEDELANKINSMLKNFFQNVINEKKLLYDFLLQCLKVMPKLECLEIVNLEEYETPHMREILFKILNISSHLTCEAITKEGLQSEVRWN